MANLEAELQKTPNKVGCYLFKNKHQHVIYVGKAKNIQKRIKQHFQTAYKSIKAMAMVKEISG